MFRKCLATLLLMCTCVYTQAAQHIDGVKDDQLINESIVLLSEWKQRLIDHAHTSGNAELAKILGDTNVQITDEIKLPSIAYALHEEGREVIIAQEFIEAINHFSPMFEAQLNRVQSRSFLELALIDVLFHELGHHATDSMYAGYASPFMIERAEREAEEWSAGQKGSLNIDEDQIGRLISLFAVLAQQSSSEKIDMRTRSMLQIHIHKACYLSSSQIAGDMCESLSSQYSAKEERVGL